LFPFLDQKLISHRYLSGSCSLVVVVVVVVVIIIIIVVVVVVGVTDLLKTLSLRRFKSDRSEIFTNVLCVKVQ